MPLLGSILNALASPPGPTPIRPMRLDDGIDSSELMSDLSLLAAAIDELGESGIIVRLTGDCCEAVGLARSMLLADELHHQGLFMPWGAAVAARHEVASLVRNGDFRLTCAVNASHPVGGRAVSDVVRRIIGAFDEFAIPVVRVNNGETVRVFLTEAAIRRHRAARAAGSR